MSNLYYNMYQKNSKKLSKNGLTLHTISVEIKKKSNTINPHKINKYNAKYYHQPKYINIKLFNIHKNFTNNSIRKTKIFKNIKYCNSFIKPSSSIKKKKPKKKSSKKIPCVSLTEINNNLKKTFNNNFKTNNLISIDINNNNKNKLNTISNSFKSLSKSKCNNGFLTPLQYYIHSRNKSTNAKLKKTNSFLAKNLNNSNNIIIKKNNTKNNSYFFSGIQKKLSETIPKEIEDPRTKIQKLKKELDKKDNELNEKNKIIEEKNKKIYELQKMCEKYENEKKIMNKNYGELKEKYEKLYKEKIEIKNEMEEYEKNFDFLKEKEITLMKILYIIKEKGVDLNTIINEITNQSNIEAAKKINESVIDSNCSSNMTIYFPDKINMKNTMENKEAKKIPCLDFTQLPEYSFQSENGQNEQSNQDNNEQNYSGINKYFKIYQKSA